MNQPWANVQNKCRPFSTYFLDEQKKTFFDPTGEKINFSHWLYRQFSVTYYIPALCRAKHIPGFPSKFLGFILHLFMFPGSVSFANKQKPFGLKQKSLKLKTKEFRLNQKSLRLEQKSIGLNLKIIWIEA